MKTRDSQRDDASVAVAVSCMVLISPEMHSDMNLKILRMTGTVRKRLLWLSLDPVIISCCKSFGQTNWRCFTDLITGYFWIYNSKMAIRTVEKNYPYRVIFIPVYNLKLHKMVMCWVILNGVKLHTWWQRLIAYSDLQRVYSSIMLTW